MNRPNQATKGTADRRGQGSDAAGPRRAGWEVAMRSTFLAVVACLAMVVSIATPVGAAIEDATSVEELLEQPDYNGESHAEILRLYQAIFGRYPDLEGAKYWIRVNNGAEDGTRHDVLAIAGFMSGSAEWSTSYAGTSDEVFLERVYTNVLGRDYDQSGFDYWLDTLKGTNATGENPDRVKLDRPTMVFYVTANPEFTKAYPFTPTGPGALLGRDDLAGVAFGTDADAALAVVIDVAGAAEGDSGWVLLSPSPEGGFTDKPDELDGSGHNSIFPEVRYVCWADGQIRTCAIFMGDNAGRRWLSGWESAWTNGFDVQAMSTGWATAELFAVGAPVSRLADAPSTVFSGGEGGMLLFSNGTISGRAQGFFDRGSGTPNFGDYIYCLTAGDRPVPGFFSTCAVPLGFPEQAQDPTSSPEFALRHWFANVDQEDLLGQRFEQLDPCDELKPGTDYCFLIHEDSTPESVLYLMGIPESHIDIGVYVQLGPTGWAVAGWTFSPPETGYEGS